MKNAVSSDDRIFYVRFACFNARNTRIRMLMTMDEKRLNLSRPGFIIPVSLKISLSSLNNEDEHSIELKAKLHKE